MKKRMSKTNARVGSRCGIHDFLPRGTSQFWFDKRDDNEKNVMCASQLVNIGERCHNGLLHNHTCEQRNNFVWKVCRRDDTQSAIPFASHQIRGWRSKNQGMCGVVGYFSNIVCTRPAKTDVWRHRGQMLVVQIMLDETVRRSARMPPSRGLT